MFLEGFAVVSQVAATEGLYYYIATPLLARIAMCGRKMIHYITSDVNTLTL